MSNPAAAVGTAAPQKTPPYAWVALVVSLLSGIAMVFSWQWLPGITFPEFIGWMMPHNPTFDPSGVGNVMGLVPIGAMIMAFPTSILVRKWGPKVGTIIGLGCAIIGSALCALFVESSWTVFLVGRFILGLGLAATIISGPTCVSIWFPDSTRGRAMAIWSCWAPIGIFTINMTGNMIFDAAGNNMVNFLWIFVVVIAVAAVLFIIFFRAPRGDEKSEVSAELKSFREVLPHFKKRQLWALIIMFAIYNYMNYAFSQYLKTWMQVPVVEGGLGWDPAMAGLIGGAIVACGILAPIGGFILDKTPKAMKWLCAVVGIIALTLCSAFAFQNSMPIFILYILFFCIGNMLLNGCCRPLVPTFVFKGGATAVALGLAFLTFFQYIGQIPSSYVFEFGKEAMGWTYSEISLYCIVPVGIIGFLISLLIKPSKKSLEEGAGAPVKH